MRTSGSPLNLSRFIHCSVINVLQGFFNLCRKSVQATACLLYHFVPYLSTTFSNIFKVICSPYAARNQLDYNIVFVSFCQQLFSTFLKFSKATTQHAQSSERRRRDLNPRAAVNDLHPFQGCPFGQLGYFSVSTNLQNLLLSISISKRRGWDSNPRALSDKRFSRPPRYDHFDTSPYLVQISAQTILPPK